MFLLRLSTSEIRSPVLPLLMIRVTNDALMIQQTPLRHRKIHGMPTFQFHEFVASARVPDSQLLLSAAADNDGTGRVHGKAVDGVLVAIQGRGCNDIHQQLCIYLHTHIHTAYNM